MADIPTIVTPYTGSNLHPSPTPFAPEKDCRTCEHYYGCVNLIRRDIWCDLPKYEPCILGSRYVRVEVKPLWRTE